MALNDSKISPLPKNKEKPQILIVDDEAVIRELFQKILSQKGYKVSTVSSGEKALKKISEYDFGLVIIDLEMPGMKGIDLLREIPAMGKSPITIVITGQMTLDSIEESIRLGCFEYVAKPFNVEDILGVIGKAFESRNLPTKNKSCPKNQPIRLSQG